MCVHGEPAASKRTSAGIAGIIEPSTAYDYENVDETVYPRYFNTSNQVSLVEKVCALEQAEAGLVFSSGMAAIMTTLLSQLQSGDHVVFQGDLYGGTLHAAAMELPRFGINSSFVDATRAKAVEEAILPTTRLVFVESPSNPLLKVVPLREIAEVCKEHHVISIIDNTFATPINQNPLIHGFDMVVHSGTKYIGGHSDLCCGFLATSSKLHQQVLAGALHFGGAVNAQTCYLIERSLKTLALRVQQQNASALTLARFLRNHKRIEKVFYPGLEDDPGYGTAKQQMTGFGGMLAFELKHDAAAFIDRLTVIRRAVSLGGVESTICVPALTSHVKISAAEREAAGIGENLVRLSTGIEAVEDLLDDLLRALEF
jgi:cystathionine beta-lyase/cystathionine gamma-synthase